MSRIQIAYGDLLGVPHLPGALELRMGALDCAGATAEVIRRAIGCVARDAFLGLLRGEGADWIEVPHGQVKCGDVVVSEVDQEGLHVSGVVSTAPAMVLTSALRVGVFATRLGAVKNIQHIYRYPGATP